MSVPLTFSSPPQGSYRSGLAAPKPAAIDILKPLMQELFNEMTLWLDQSGLAKLATVSQAITTRTRAATHEHPRLHLRGTLAGLDLMRALAQYPKFNQLTISGVDPTQDLRFAHHVDKALEGRALHSFTFTSSLLTEVNQFTWINLIQKINLQALVILEFSNVKLKLPYHSEVQEHQQEELALDYEEQHPQPAARLIEQLIPLLKNCPKLKKITLSEDLLVGQLETRAQVQSCGMAILENLPRALEHLTFTFRLDERHVDTILKKFNGEIRSCDLIFWGEEFTSEKTWEILHFLPFSTMSSIRLSGLRLTTDMFVYIASRLARNQNLGSLKFSDCNTPIDSCAAIAVIGSIQALNFRELVFSFKSKSSGLNADLFARMQMKRWKEIRSVSIPSIGCTVEDLKHLQAPRSSEMSTLFTQYLQSLQIERAAHVTIRNESATRHALKQLIHQIGKNSTLKTLFLSDFNLSTDSVIEIIHALKTGELVQLDVYSTQFLDEAKITQELRLKIPSWKKIERIRIGNTDYFLKLNLVSPHFLMNAKTPSTIANKEPVSIAIPGSRSLSPAISSPISQKEKPSLPEIASNGSSSHSPIQPGQTPDIFSENQQPSLAAPDELSLHLENSMDFGHNLLPEENIEMTPAENNQ